MEAGPVSANDDPVQAALRRAMAATQVGDLDTLRRMIDWPLAGGRRLATRLAELDDAGRAAQAPQALLDLFASVHRPLQIKPELRRLAATISRSVALRPASESQRAAVLDRLSIPPVPSGGLGAEQIEQLAELRTRAANLAEVYVVTAAAGSVLAIAWAPDSRRLVPVNL
jgi:hypothetical protein